MCDEDNYRSGKVTAKEINRKLIQYLEKFYVLEPLKITYEHHFPNVYTEKCGHHTITKIDNYGSMFSIRLPIMNYMKANAFLITYVADEIFIVNYKGFSDLYKYYMPENTYKCSFPDPIARTLYKHQWIIPHKTFDTTIVYYRSPQKDPFHFYYQYHQPTAWGICCSDYRITFDPYHNSHCKGIALGTDSYWKNKEKSQEEKIRNSL